MDNLTVLDALRSPGIRLSNGDKWLVIDDDGIFVVYQRKYNAKKTEIIVATVDEHKAVAALMDEE